MAKTGTRQQLSDSASESDTTSVETLSTQESPISDLIQPSIPDPVCELYNDSNHGFVLARTFRSGDLNGIDSELAYLQNFPGIIVANPTTVISRKIRTRTISQTPGSDWSGEPSFLFTVRPEEGITIADYGLGALNSFCSSLAIRLAMDKINPPPSGKFSYAQSLNIIADYLRKNWRSFLIDLEREYAASHLKNFDGSGMDPSKKFLKEYNLFFNKSVRYDELFHGLSGHDYSQDPLFRAVAALIGNPHFQTSDELSTLATALEDAHDLKKISHDVPLEPHPLAALLAEAHNETERAEFQESTTLRGKLATVAATKDYSASSKKQHMHRLFFQALGAYKKSMAQIRKSKGQSKAERQLELKTESSIYDDYSSFIDNASRHNELLSRVYPWEISGIEWGENDSSRMNSVVSLLRIKETRQNLLKEFEEQGIDTPLFVDFVVNKLSIGYPNQSPEALTAIFNSIKTEEPVKICLEEMIYRIKKCLGSQISIYEYVPSEQKMTNIFSILYHNGIYTQDFNDDLYDINLEDACLEDNSGISYDQETLRRYMELIHDGIKTYETSLSLEGLIEVNPPSKLKRIRVTIVDSDLVKFQKYWEKAEAEQQGLMNELFCVLGRDIINRPYVDDNRTLQDSLNTIVYRPNHDVTHAVRRTLYADHIIDIIQKSPDSPFKDVIQQFTPEERACLNVMLFLYRSGRTNEQSTGVDDSYATRSANIFEIVARKLGFNPSLVASMKHLFYFIDFPTPLPLFVSPDEVSTSASELPIRLKNTLQDAATGYQGDFETQQKKAYLFSFISEIGDTMDLVRCSSWRFFFSTENDYLAAKEKGLITSRNFKFGSLVPKMKHLLPDDVHANHAIEHLILIAKKSCEFTGTPVFYMGFDEADIVSRYKNKTNISNIENMINDPMFWEAMNKVPDDCSGPLLRDIKSYWTVHVGDCIKQLASALPPSYIPNAKIDIEFTTSHQEPDHDRIEP